MNTPDSMHLVAALVLLAAGAGFAQHRSIAVAGGSASAAGTSHGTETHSQSIAVGRGPVVIAGQAHAASDSDQIMKRVDEALQEALEKAGDLKEVKQALEAARKEMQSALAAGLKRHPGKSTNVEGKGDGGRSNGYQQSGYGAVVGLGRALASSAGAVPALITTRGVDDAVREAWVEDLQIMDRLLSQGIEQVAGDAPRRAMGIRLLFSGNGEPPPMYVEDFGVIFDYPVKLALQQRSQEPKPDRRSTSSAWENARRQVQQTTIDEDNVRMSVLAYTSKLLEPQAPPEFDAAKVETLRESLLGILAEAKNIRHLRPNEVVVVTLSGTDDEGNPKRLTIKVSKSDIDALANGALTPEEFRNKAAMGVS